MELVNIGDIFKFVRNGISIKQDAGAKGIPITRIETIWNRTIDSSRFGYANVFELDDRISGYLLQNGDLLMTHINSPKHLGKTALYNNSPENLIHGMNLLALRPNKELTDSKFIFHYLNSRCFHAKLLKISNQSVNQASFSAGNLKKLKIPLPPLSEQKRIASILDEADKVRQLNKKLIEKYNKLSQSLFLDMFGDPVTNPKKYEIVTLEDVTSKITDGVHAKPEYTETGVEFISVKDITTGTLDFNNCKYISEEAHKKYYKRCNPEYLDILYTKVGATYGRPAIVDVKKEFSLYVSVALIKPIKEKVNPYFLKEALANPAIKRQADRSIKGIGVPDLHLNMIKKFILPLPSLNEQKQFSFYITAIEKQKALAEESLAKSEELFGSLLQRLLDSARSPS